MRMVFASVALALVVGGMFFISESIYPVRVSFTFPYQGKIYQKSYLTIVRAELGNFIEVSLIRWTHGRSRISMPLPDGSLIVLEPQWLPEWQGYSSGQQYSSIGRWVWFDNAAVPKEIVEADGATRPPDGIVPPPFVWTNVRATIQRVSWQFLSEAAREDRSEKGDDPIIFSNNIGGTPNFHGALYTDATLVHLSPSGDIGNQNLSHLLHESGWKPVGNGCRGRPVFQAKIYPLAGLYSFMDRVDLLRRGDIWTSDGGPHHGGPVIMYATGRHVDASPNGFSVMDYSNLAIENIHAVEWQSETCTGIQVPPSAIQEIIEFPDGSFSLLSPSINMMVLRD